MDPGTVDLLIRALPQAVMAAVWGKIARPANPRQIRPGPLSAVFVSSPDRLTDLLFLALRHRLQRWTISEFHSRATSFGCFFSFSFPFCLNHTPACIASDAEAAWVSALQLLRTDIPLLSRAIASPCKSRHHFTDIRSRAKGSRSSSLSLITTYSSVYTPRIVTMVLKGNEVAEHNNAKSCWVIVHVRKPLVAVGSEC